MKLKNVAGGARLLTSPASEDARPTEGMKRCVSTRFWTAPAERSGDGAFRRKQPLRTREMRRACESGVALRLPPQSKTRSGLRRLMVSICVHSWTLKAQR
jgi:hypothetical protein